MNRLIKTILIISIFLPFASVQAQVDNLVVEFQQTPLFNEANFLPGGEITRWVKVTNNSGATQRIAIEAINKNDPDDFASQLNLVIKEGMTVIFNNTLAQFFSQGETYLSSLASGNQTQYDFTIAFNSGSGNDYQEKALGFDILVGFEGTEGGGGGGWLPPGLTIQNEATATTTEISVVIVWTTSYPATSQVIYAKDGEFHTLCLTQTEGCAIGTPPPPKYGYAHTTPELDISPKVTSHLVIIDGLASGTKYYYRTVSHASLAISEEHSFTTLVAQGQVLTPTASIGSAEPTGEIGASAATPGSAGPAGLNQNDLEATAPVESESPVTEGPNPLLATLSNFITLGTGNNIIGIIILFSICLIIYFAYSYFAKKRKYRLKNK